MLIKQNKEFNFNYLVFMAGMSLTFPSKIDPQTEQCPRMDRKISPLKLTFAFLNVKQQGSLVCKKKLL